MHNAANSPASAANASNAGADPARKRHDQIRRTYGVEQLGWECRLVKMQNAAVGENEFSGDRRVAGPEKVSDFRSRVGDR